MVTPTISQCQSSRTCCEPGDVRGGSGWDVAEPASPYRPDEGHRQGRYEKQ